MLSYFSAFKKS